MTTYELTSGTREEFENVQAQMVSDFAAHVIGAEVYKHNTGYGRVVSCFASSHSFDSAVITVYFDETNEEKNYLLSSVMTIASLVFTDTSLVELYNSFKEEQYKLKAQYNKAVEDVQRRQKEEAKLEKKRKDNEKKAAGMKAQAEKEFEKLASSKAKIAKADEFYYALGWVAKHVGTITAKMPDYLEPAFIKHFGDVEHTVVDSTKVGPAGFTSQWHLSMEASLVKAKEIPAMLTEYLSQNGKKISKTSFVWDLVDKYGFKFGKKQDVVEILRCVPIEYVYFFNEGFQA